jgi:hypothetical protein
MDIRAEGGLIEGRKYKERIGKVMRIVLGR